MSEIYGLLKELCSNSAPRVSLGEMGEFVRGTSLQKSDLLPSGDVPAIHYGEIHTSYGAWTDSSVSFVRSDLGTKLRKAKPGDLVIATTSEDDEAVGKAVAWMGTGPVAVSSDAFIYRHSFDPRFISYFFQTRSFQEQKRRFITGTKVRRLSGESLARIEAPNPPLKVQKAVAEILDRLTDLETELAVKLEAERDARLKQYSHYRDSLLTFPEATGGVGGCK